VAAGLPSAAREAEVGADSRRANRLRQNHKQFQLYISSLFYSEWRAISAQIKLAKTRSGLRLHTKSIAALERSSLELEA
jgi:hypothetical protein